MSSCVMLFRCGKGGGNAYFCLSAAFVFPQDACCEVPSDWLDMGASDFYVPTVPEGFMREVVIHSQAYTRSSATRSRSKHITRSIYYHYFTTSTTSTAQGGPAVLRKALLTAASNPHDTDADDTVEGFLRSQLNHNEQTELFPSMFNFYDAEAAGPGVLALPAPRPRPSAEATANEEAAPVAAEESVVDASPAAEEPAAAPAEEEAAAPVAPSQAAARTAEQPPPVPVQPPLEAAALSVRSIAPSVQQPSPSHAPRPVTLQRAPGAVVVNVPPPVALEAVEQARAAEAAAAAAAAAAAEKSPNWFDQPAHHHPGSSSVASTPSTAAALPRRGAETAIGAKLLAVGDNPYAKHYGCSASHTPHHARSLDRRSNVHAG
jgi:hypothetical protein